VATPKRLVFACCIAPAAAQSITDGDTIKIDGVKYRLLASTRPTSKKVPIKATRRSRTGYSSTGRDVHPHVLAVLQAGAPRAPDASLDPPGTTVYLATSRA
jgi:hypothetical protein